MEDICKKYGRYVAPISKICTRDFADDCGLSAIRGRSRSQVLPGRRAIMAWSDHLPHSLRLALMLHLEP